MNRPYKMHSHDININQIRERALEAYDLEQPMHRNEAIFRSIAELLIDCGHYTLPEWAPLSFKDGKKKHTVHGYEIDEEFNILTLFYLIDSHSKTPLYNSWTRELCSSSEIDYAVESLESIATLASNIIQPADDSDPASEMCDLLHQFASQGKNRISICILTTGELSKEGWKRSDRANFHTSVWDSFRICNALKSSTEQLSISFEKYGGIDCLLDEKDFLAMQNKKTAVLLGKMPGECLADLYFDHRTRLLQQNIRAFLNFSGKINRGIRDTIKSEPDRFLSYNNGIAATASEVILKKQADNVYKLISAKDFQVVNGGQTTAALMHTRLDKLSDLSNIQVAMKLTVVSPQELENLVPKISRFANSQNKIQDADFASNHPWLVRLEDLSRKTEAPKDDKSNGQPITWYFERVRGQFNVDLSRCKSPSQKTFFRSRSPARCKFDKTSLASVIMAWEGEPTIVSLGRQKCFGAFMKKLYALKESKNVKEEILPSATDFKKISVLHILKREAGQICKELDISTIRSTVINYSIAFFSYETKGKLPFEEIWKNQKTPDNLYKNLRLVIRGVEKILHREAAEKKQIVTEYAKKQECFKTIIESSIEMDLKSCSGWSSFSISEMLNNIEQKEEAEIFVRFTEQEWIKISRALEKKTRNNAFASMAKEMAKTSKQKKKPTAKQSRILAKCLLLLREKDVSGVGIEKVLPTEWNNLEKIALLEK